MDQQEDYQEACLQCSSVRWSVSDEGRFFCTVCHNVIERTQETTQQTPRKSRVTTTDSMGTLQRLGRACRWRLCEGFQFVLIEQATALVRLGADPDFKDQVLWPLWRRFLQTQRQAYTHAPKPDSDPLRHGLRLRVRRRGAVRLVGGGRHDHEEDAGSRPPGARVESAGADAGRPDRVSGPSRASRGRLRPDGRRGLARQSVPSHGEVLRETRTLLRLLRLPAFPEIRAWDPLHPRMLSLRYLADANLPDELHPWVCALWERTGPTPGVLPAYDLQAAALVVLALKILFGLDDRSEWDISDDASAVSCFSPRRWYRLLRAAKLRAQRKEENSLARKPWKATPLFRRGKRGRVDTKRKRNAEQVKLCFERLRSGYVDASPPAAPSSFTFLWGAGRHADGPSLRRRKGAAVRATFWRSPLGSHSRWKRGAHYAAAETTMPHSFAWVLELFAFLLRVSPAQLYWEEVSVERRILAAHKWRPSSSLFGQRRRKKRGNPSF
ncbi:TATA box-binding protein-associated factor RNA polymerase I subunit B isoform X3 [Stigmatopora argus]